MDAGAWTGPTSRQVSVDNRYTRGFSRLCYTKHSWLAGCDVSNGFHCSPCLLFQSVGTDVLWTTTGVRELKYLSEKCKWHKNSHSHLDNSLKLRIFGRVSIAEQLDEDYRVGIRRQNEEVTKKSSHTVQNYRLCEILWGL